MRVLVTGGAGYIGSVIVERLAEDGYSPVIYDSLVKGHAAGIPAGVPFIQADVLDTDTLRKTLRTYEIEAVIHMAGLIEVGLSVSNPERFFEANVGGSISVVRAMVDAGVRRLVFSSTAALYGDADVMPLTEEVPTCPTNPYGESKLMVEQMLATVAPAHHMVCTALRYFNAAGATATHGEMHEPETHLIPLVLQAAASNQTVRIFGTDYPTADGTAVRDYIHVLDLAGAHLLALHIARPGLHVYNVGTGQGYSVRQIIEMSRAVTGCALPIEELPRRAGDQVMTIASSAKIRTELGWSPEHSDLRSIIASAWQWQKRAG